MNTTTRQEIDDIDKAISNLNKIKRDLLKKLTPVKNVNTQTHRNVWVIVATSNKESHDVEACFTSKENALKLCPSVMMSLDGINWWNYKVCPRKTSTYVLDPCIISGFPYTSF